MSPDMEYHSADRYRFVLDNAQSAGLFGASDMKDSLVGVWNEWVRCGGVVMACHSVRDGFCD